LLAGRNRININEITSETRWLRHLVIAFNQIIITLLA
jgi:hypothetical protein